MLLSGGTVALFGQRDKVLSELGQQKKPEPGQVGRAQGGTPANG